MPKSQHVQQMWHSTSRATRHSANRKILLGRSGTHCDAHFPPRCCSPCTSRTQAARFERSEPSATKSCPIPPAHAPERSSSSPLRGPSFPFLSSPAPTLSQLIPPSSLTTPTSVEPTSVATGRRRAAPPAPPPPPPSLPSCCTCLNVLHRSLWLRREHLQDQGHYWLVLELESFFHCE